MKVPREDSNDRDPMWIGKTVYFLSDRDGPITLFAYDTETQKVSRVIENKNGFGISSASAGDRRDRVFAVRRASRLRSFHSRRIEQVSVTVSGRHAATAAALGKSRQAHSEFRVSRPLALALFSKRMAKS